jgi:hypothetical protein
MKRALRVAASLLLAFGSGNATTSFSATGGVEPIATPVAVESASISPALTPGDAVQSGQDPKGDAYLLLFVFAESGPDLPGNSRAFETTAPTPYTTDTYTSESGESIVVAEDVEFVTYFLHRVS